MAARYGGDEFTFILPDTETLTAQTLMEDIRRTVAETNLLKEVVPKSQWKSTETKLPKVTTSQGLACFPDHASDAKTLREAADAALYRAKEAGRNRVVVADAPAASSSSFTPS